MHVHKHKHTHLYSRAEDLTLNVHAKSYAGYTGPLCIPGPLVCVCVCVRLS